MQIGTEVKGEERECASILKTLDFSLNQLSSYWNAMTHLY